MSRGQPLFAQDGRKPQAVQRAEARRHEHRCAKGQRVAPFPREASAARPALHDAGVESPASLGPLDWFEVGCGLDAEPKTYDKAIAAYRNAIALDPEFADAHCNLGAALYNKGERKEARRCFERCLELRPEHVEGHFNLANLLEEEDDSARALQHYLRALERDPFYADLHINLALLYEKLGRAAKGLEHWRRYLQVEPDGALSEIARQRLREGR